MKLSSEEFRDLVAALKEQPLDDRPELIDNLPIDDDQKKRLLKTVVFSDEDYKFFKKLTMLQIASSIIGYIFDFATFFLLSTVGWPLPVCISLGIAYVVCSAIPFLRVFTAYFFIFTIIAFITAIVRLGFFNWFTAVFLVCFTLFFILMYLQKKAMATNWDDDQPCASPGTKSIRLKQSEFDRLNHYSGGHILLVVRLIVGLFFSIGSINAAQFVLGSQVNQDVITLSILLTILLGICILLFFIKSKAFIWLYLCFTISNVISCIVYNNFGSAVSYCLWEGAFLIYLFTSLRSAVVFKLKPVHIIPYASQTLPDWQIGKIVDDLLSAPAAEAIARINAMSFPDTDREEIRAKYLVRSGIDPNARPPQIQTSASIKRKPYPTLIGIGILAATVVVLFIAAMNQSAPSNATYVPAASYKPSETLVPFSEYNANEFGSSAATDQQTTNRNSTTQESSAPLKYDGTNVSLRDLSIRCTIPENYAVFTRNMSKHDPVLQEAGVDYDAMMEYMDAGKRQLDAVDLAFPDVDILISSSRDEYSEEVWDGSTLTEADVTQQAQAVYDAYIDVAKELFGASADLEVYCKTFNNRNYVCYDFFVGDKLFQREFMTWHKGNQIFFNIINFEQNRLTDAQLDSLALVMASTVYL